LHAAVWLFAIFAFFSSVCVQYSEELGKDANIRLQELEQCDCLNHDGFYTLRFSNENAWHGEVILSSYGPITFIRSIQLWRDSPEHNEIMIKGKYFGYAQSDLPSQSGLYYAVMILEW